MKAKIIPRRRLLGTMLAAGAGPAVADTEPPAKRP